MRGSSSSAFSVSLPAELTIHCTFPWFGSLQTPGLPVSFCARQSAGPGVRSRL